MDGWGYADFTSASFSATADVELSECRELVEVPGGAEWKIRRLLDSAPEFCWKFSGTSSIVQYHFDMAQSRQSEKIFLDEDAGDRPQLPVFYATLPYFASPFEISVQPKYLDRVRANITSELNEVYNKDPPCFESEQLFAPIACACLVGGQWYRGRVTEIRGVDVATVELVDFGTEKIVNQSAIHPLLARFGRMPPMALRCRVKDVYVNDLDTYKVDQFKDLIDSCGNLVRAELWNTTEPYFVNLYHPTIDGYNLGKLFYKPPGDAQRELAKQRKWLEHKRRQQCENDSDFDDQESCAGDFEEEEEPPIQYIRSFDRSGKVFRAGADTLFVCHVENVRLIYLQTEWMVKQMKEIERRMHDEWSQFPLMPAEWLTRGAACAVRYENGVHRCAIESVEGEGIALLLIDHGYHVNVDNSDKLRLLPEDELYMEPPMLYVVGLNGCFDYFPHPSETAILRDILPVGTALRFKCDTRHKRVPLRGSLTLENGLIDVREELNDLLSARGVDVWCNQLLPYTPVANNQPVKLFVHRTQCPTPLLKGNLEVAPLPVE